MVESVVRIPSTDREGTLHIGWGFYFLNGQLEEKYARIAKQITMKNKFALTEPQMVTRIYKHYFRAVEFQRTYQQINNKRFTFILNTTTEKELRQNALVLKLEKNYNAKLAPLLPHRSLLMKFLQ